MLYSAFPRAGGFVRSLLRWIDGTVEQRLRRPCRRVPPAGRRIRLLLEELEPRRVPVMNNWALTSGGDWDTSSNWSLCHVTSSTQDAVGIVNACDTTPASCQKRCAVH